MSMRLFLLAGLLSLAPTARADDSAALLTENAALKAQLAALQKELAAEKTANAEDRDRRRQQTLNAEADARENARQWAAAYRQLYVSWQTLARSWDAYAVTRTAPQRIPDPQPATIIAPAVDFGHTLPNGAVLNMDGTITRNITTGGVVRTETR